MRFLVDENLPPTVSEILRSLGHDVRDVGGTPLRSARDEVLWRPAAEEARILITRDLDFPLAELPRPPGLVLVRLPYWFVSEQIARFVANWVQTKEPPDVLDKITVLSPGPPRTRDL